MAKTQRSIAELAEEVQKAQGELRWANKRATGALRDREAAHMRLLEAQEDLNIALSHVSPAVGDRTKIGRMVQTNG